VRIHVSESRALKSRSSHLLCTVLSIRAQLYFRYVEEKYKLEMGNAQITQLSRAIAVGAEKGIFSLPKGCKFRFRGFVIPLA
jgi:linker histone H1 and H5 family